MDDDFVSSEEKALWLELNSATKKISTKKYFQKAPIHHKIKVDHQKMLHFYPKTSAIHIEPGYHAHLHSNFLKKIKNGKMEIDAKIDLHGMNLAQAEKNFLEFIQNAIVLKKRLLLIVTGKGTNNNGAIKNEVAKWVNHPQISGYIAYFDYPPPVHGGKGALYLLLRIGASEQPKY